jgi:hypothetical protein
MAAPVLKGTPFSGSKEPVLTHHAPVIQIMISQAIIGYRTWGIARRSKEMGIFLLTFGLIVTILEWYSNVDARIPVQDEASALDNAPVTIPGTNGIYSYLQGK